MQGYEANFEMATGDDQDAGATDQAENLVSQAVQACAEGVASTVKITDDGRSLNCHN